MNTDIKQELGFIFIVNGKKFLTKKEAVKYKKRLNKKYFTFFLKLLCYITYRKIWIKTMKIKVLK